MTSRVPGKRVRKTAVERRREIVDTAAIIGLYDGLECVTLRRVAETLDVRGGLISHYFPAIEELVAQAFTSAASGELEALLPEPPAQDTARAVLDCLRRFFALTTSSEFDRISRLWLNARHLSRYRPVLREHVTTQELLWHRRLTRLITEGSARQALRCDDPWGSAVHILTVIDGASAYVNTSAELRGTSPLLLARTVAERELGLPPGTLGSPAENRDLAMEERLPESGNAPPSTPV
ncbi:TetR family transcriptional regulator [Streptomyces sp. Lzd4kr]|nr:TetR family transcriptional regulator [Streptomyces sp. Lzd4kr]